MERRVASCKLTIIKPVAAKRNGFTATSPLLFFKFTSISLCCSNGCKTFLLTPTATCNNVEPSKSCTRLQLHDRLSRCCQHTTITPTASIHTTLIFTTHLQQCEYTNSTRAHNAAVVRSRLQRQLFDSKLTTRFGLTNGSLSRSFVSSSSPDRTAISSFRAYDCAAKFECEQTRHINRNVDVNRIG
jgi:hypothetical protein